MKERTGTIVFVIKDGMVLLAKKTRVLGIGLWNGYGGGFDSETDQDLADCAVREFGEESGGASICKSDVEKVAYIEFHNGDSFLFKAHVFIVNNIIDIPTDSGEMIEPTWFSVDELPPKEQFMDSDMHWIPRILKGEKLIADVWYDGNFNLTERGVEIKKVDVLD
ncbi:MAG: NUDIX domain-containing protein [bacterium]